MSGVEVLAVIGILANVIQLLDFSRQAFARIKECKDDSSRLPKVFWTLENQLPLISHALKITWKQASSDELDDKACESLRPVIQDCSASITELKLILERLSPSPTDPTWKKGFKAVKSCFHDKDVAAIESSLSRSLTVINQYHGAYTASTTGAILKKLTAAVATVPEYTASAESIPVRHFIVPTIWTDDFTGRGEAMDQLDRVLSIPDKHRRMAIIGLGGVGKTRVMIEYAYRFKESKDVSVFWIHASSPSRFNKACLEIAKAAQIQGWNDPKTDKVGLVSKWLESPQAGKWIILLDNADDYDLLYGSGNLAKALPKSSNGAILMTTRDARVGKEFAKRSTILLGALTVDESIRLLVTRLGADHSEAEDLMDLAKELCGIPLALVQASSFIEQNYLSIPSYLELYRASDRDKIELLSEDFDDEFRDAETLNPVAATWTLTFDHIFKHDFLAADILSIMSVLDSQAIPESLLYAGLERLKFTKAMGTLQAFSLVTARSDGPVWEGRKERLFDFHRLVRLAMRKWLELHGQIESYTARTLTTLAELFSDGQWETRGKWSTYLPHAAVLLASEQMAGIEDLTMSRVSHDEALGTVNHTPEGVVCPVCAASILTILSLCQYTIGSLFDSIELAEKAYRLRRQFLGETHLDTLSTIDLISKPAKDLYLFPRAVEACKLAIAGKSEALGPEHPSTLTSMATLGITYRAMGLLKEAKDIGTFVLDTRRVNLGATHPDTLLSLCYVATASRAGGDYDTAVKLESEKLQGWTNLKGPSHPETLEAMAGLAWALACQGQYTRAAQLNSNSLNQQLELRGPQFPFSLWTMSNMAVILGMQGKYFEAEQLGEKCLALREKLLGASHPFCYVSKLYLAWLYNETNRLKKAEDIELEVLAFQEEFYKSTTHHEVLLTRSQLASTYTFMERHVEAEQIKKEVMDKRLEQMADTHPVIFRCKSSLGMTLLKLGKVSEAEILLLDAWESQKSTLGDEHPETLTTMAHVGQLWERRARLNEAKKLYQDLVDMSTKTLGIEHPRTVSRIAELGRLGSLRRSSETAVSIHTSMGVKVELELNMKKLGVIDERELGRAEVERG